jgi:CheY-like chemotaxis protein
MVAHLVANSRPRAILLVEDHPDTALAIGAFLSTMGFHVTTAGSVEEAVRNVVAQKFDVIISDVGLPDGNGISLINCIRPFCDTPAIALTAYTSDEDAERCKRAGFDLHIGKPVDPATLRDAIESLAAAPSENPRQAP